MRVDDLARMIVQEADELNHAVYEYARISRSQNRPATQGDGYKGGAYDGLPQSATRSSIERKILTIREQLNTLRKELNRVGISGKF